MKARKWGDKWREIGRSEQKAEERERESEVCEKKTKTQMGQSKKGREAYKQGAIAS